MEKKYRLTNQARIAHLDILDEIGFFGITAENIKQDLDSLEDFDELIININSFGGEVFEGFAIYNMLRSIRQNTVANIIGFAGSIATVIALGAKRVSIADNGFFQIHNVMGGATGTSEDLREQAEQIDKINEQIIQIYVDKTRQAPEAIRNLMNAGSDNAGTMMTAQEAFDFGFVDTVTKGMRLAAKINTEDGKEIHSIFNESINNKSINMENSEENKAPEISQTWLEEKFSAIENSIKSFFNSTSEETEETETKVEVAEESNEVEVDWTNKFSELENKVAEVSNQIASKEEEIASLKEDIASKEARIAELESTPVGEGLNEATEVETGEKEVIDWKNSSIDYNYLNKINEQFKA